MVCLRDCPKHGSFTTIICLKCAPDEIQRLEKLAKSRKNRIDTMRNTTRKDKRDKEHLSGRVADMEERLEEMLYYIKQRPDLSDQTSADYSRQVYQTLKILGREPIGHCCTCHSLIEQGAPHAKWDDGTLTHDKCKKVNDD